ncbi:DUF58 domain-containing protein [Planococcus lenghuensis]|uniref:DUF58 domain-containing protein n=1 Tax=Planococcus lenghuensis TaxID=2213202 RepID=A0A1Q2KW26_9BACL|nr:DUF58 domain-containing protein [Planococcus lenghuensis]AQQ52418.1 hypothetical protein B0X71_04340 [Planococcus lenghuensis]
MKRRTRYIAFGGRLLFVGFLLIVTFSFAMFQGGFVSWFIFYMSLPFGLYSFFLALYPLKDIRITRSIETANIQSGGRFTAAVTMERSIPFPLLYTVFSEATDFEVIGKKEREMAIPGFRRSLSWTYEITDMPRGEHILEGIQVEVADFFGWIRKSRLVPYRQRVLVYPRITELTYRPSKTNFEQGTAASPFTLVRDTTIPAGLREYQPGDKMTWIHWKSFARTQTLQTKEFEERQSQELFLLADRSPSPSYETQVELAASILRAVVRSGASAAYLAAGKNRTHFSAINGEGQFQQLMHHLMKVQPDSSTPFADMIEHDFGLAQATNMVFITGELTEEALNAIQRGARQLKMCTCLIVKNKDTRLTADEEAVHHMAKLKGFHVKVILPGNFENAFTEVGRT